MLPEDKERINFSNFKTQRCFQSLKTLCLEKVVACLPSYAKQGLTKLSSKLPTTLTSLVYHEFMQSLDNFKGDPVDKVRLFAGHGLEEFDCRILSWQRKPKHSLQPLLEHLFQESPNLRCFKDNRDIYYKTRVTDSMPLCEYYCLHLMSNLVVLEVRSYAAKDSDLQFIGLNLPLLRRLRVFSLFEFVECGKISTEGLEFLTQLKYLKHLIIHLQKPYDTEKSVELGTACLRLMPQVNSVVSEYDSPSFHVHHEIPSFEGRPVELGLEHFVVSHRSEIPANVSLPHVTKITLVDEAPFPFDLQQFKKLQHLQFAENEDDYELPLIVEQTVSQVGHLLKTLYCLHYDSLDLMRILPKCPNLEELYLDEVQMNADNLNVSSLKNSVSKNLKVFSQERTVFGNRDEDRTFESRGLLHLLLTSCPKLESLKLNGIKFQKDELDLVISDMECGVLDIQKLLEIEIKAYVKEKEDIECFDEFAGKFYSKAEIYTNLKSVYINEWITRRSVNGADH